MMNKSNISIALRSFGLMKFADTLRFYFFKYKNRNKNLAFLDSNPDVAIPPDYLVYEAFQLDYDEYYTKSKDSAMWVLNYFKKYIPLSEIKILDWGCGPGRIIRHLPQLLDDKSRIYGTDYNKASIDWCKENINNVSFNWNGLEAKLPYKENFFNAIYGISIFTHLPEDLHYEWIRELKRVLAYGGVLFVTTHGISFVKKLTSAEAHKFEFGNIVIRGKTTAGHRTFTAYHPLKFMNKLFENMRILEHVEIPSNNGKAQQDIWIVQKL